jgi:hypothetical protein
LRFRLEISDDGTVAESAGGRERLILACASMKDTCMHSDGKTLVLGFSFDAYTPMTLEAER